MSVSEPSPLSLSEYLHVLRNDLVSFTQCAFHELNPGTDYVPGPHIEIMASKLEACRRGEIKRLIVCVPPRSLKSHCASISYPAWLLAHNPTEEIICASYGQDLAEKLARDTRKIMNSPWYRALFYTRLAADRQAAHDFTTNGKGGRMATSVGGVLTGRGANVIIIDDPIKPDEALSETQRNRANEWFDNSVRSRLNDKAKGCMIIVMQRLHQDDLVGHVLDQEPWEVVSLPAIAEEQEIRVVDGPLGRTVFRRDLGEALQPAREPVRLLQDIRLQIGEYNFASQYQQTPIPLGGTMVKREWLKFYEPGSEPSKFSRIVQSWDTANKSGELNDFSVCTTWGVIKHDVYLLHVFRKRMNYPDLKRAVIDRARQHKNSNVVIEDKASGTQLIQELKGDGLHVHPYTPPPSTDKLMRLHSQTTWFENGRVFLPTEAPWLNEYVLELTGFPGTRFDDQVDSTTQALDYIRQTPGPIVIDKELLRRLQMEGPYWRRRLAMTSYRGIG